MQYVNHGSPAIPPSRGLILDRNGVVLADNQPAFNLELMREQVGGIKAAEFHALAAGRDRSDPC